jgi:60 kDa SS-A/Ro ribonucleoprotein
MRTNVNLRFTEKTHEGAPASRMTPLQALRRSVMSCLLWEKEFYEDGQTIAERIEKLAAQVTVQQLADCAIEARNVAQLRHVPLLLLRSLAARGDRSLLRTTIPQVIRRADEIAEFVSLYFEKGRRPLAKQMKRGLGDAFRKFDEYQLAKYEGMGAIKLRDVLRLTHPKPSEPGAVGAVAPAGPGRARSPGYVGVCARRRRRQARDLHAPPAGGQARLSGPAPQPAGNDRRRRRS